eukprot:Pgem_evm1s9046
MNIITVTCDHKNDYKSGIQHVCDNENNILPTIKPIRKSLSDSQILNACKNDNSTNTNCNNIRKRNSNQDNIQNYANIGNELVKEKASIIPESIYCSAEDLNNNDVHFITTTTSTTTITTTAKSDIQSDNDNYNNNQFESIYHNSVNVNNINNYTTTNLTESIYYNNNHRNSHNNNDDDDADNSNSDDEIIQSIKNKFQFSLAISKPLPNTNTNKE